MYVTGATTSLNFPSVVGGPTNSGNSDVFIARYSDSLLQLKNLAFYGGLGDDSGNAIAILQGTGHIYVAGSTTSSAGLTNITGSYSGGNGDAMLLRFDGNLSTVLSATYFGGNGIDTATALAVDTVAAEVVMVGETTSTNLPVGLGGGAQPAAMPASTASSRVSPRPFCQFVRPISAAREMTGSRPWRSSPSAATYWLPVRRHRRIY